MTRDEAILCEKSYIGETNCVDCKYYGTETCQSRESHKMAIKALEQEPILDKIRAEIKTLPIAFTSSFDMKQDCLEILDKYKAESEDKE